MKNTNEEETQYRLQRRAFRDGISDYKAYIAVAKLKFMAIGFVGLVIISNIFVYIIDNSPKESAKKKTKTELRLEKKEQAYKKLMHCKKIHKPVGNKCEKVWWKWIVL